jgi:Na+-driven multidrug efflux pump
MTQLESPFSRKLGPVPQAPLVIARGYRDGDREKQKWSWQQTIIFALIVSTGLWGLIFWAIRTLLA